MNDHEAMKKKLRRPLPMRGFERRLYAAVLLTPLFGVAWSLAARDWQFFERSGSLVVVVGVVLTWRDFVQTLGNVESFYRAEYARSLRDFDTQRPTGIIAGVMHDGKREDIESKQAHAVELIAMLKNRLRTTEAVIVCLGTLVWGYGSPLGNALWSFQ